MQRRQFITLLGGAAVACSQVARAQSKNYVVGFLGANSPSAAGHLASAFAARLHDLGWVDGRNVRIDYRWANGETAKFRELAADFVAAGVDVIVTTGNAPTMAVYQQTKSIPIVMAASASILTTGLVKSLARPGGNVTGLTFAPDDTVGKRIELLKETIVDLKRLAVLFNPDGGDSEVGVLREIAPSIGVELVIFEFRITADLHRIANHPERAAIGGLYVRSDPLVFTNRRAINEFAIREKLPTVHRLREYAEDGGLISYGPDFLTFYRRSADFVDKILRGAKTEDLPIEQPTKFELVLNLKTAKAIGISVPSTLLARADEVIE